MNSKYGGWGGAEGFEVKESDMLRVMKAVLADVVEVSEEDTAHEEEEMCVHIVEKPEGDADQDKEAEIRVHFCYT